MGCSASRLPPPAGSPPELLLERFAGKIEPHEVETVFLAPERVPAYEPPPV